MLVRCQINALYFPAFAAKRRKWRQTGRLIVWVHCTVLPVPVDTLRPIGHFPPRPRSGYGTGLWRQPTAGNNFAPQGNILSGGFNGLGGIMNTWRAVTKEIRDEYTGQWEVKAFVVSPDGKIFPYSSYEEAQRRCRAIQTNEKAVWLLWEKESSIV